MWGTLAMHVCEVQGHDIEGNGSEKMPFKTPIKAVEAVKGDLTLVAAIKVRKAMAEGYQPIAKAAMKKVLKLHEGNLKKAQKAAERAEQDAIDAEKARVAELAKLEEAKSVVLELDPSLPTASKVCSVLNTQKMRFSNDMGRLKSGNRQSTVANESKFLAGCIAIAFKERILPLLS